MWGVKDQEVHVNVYIGPPSLRKNPLSAMGRTLLGMDVAEDKGGNPSLVMTLQIIPRNSKRTRAEKDSGENGNVRGKCCHDCI